MKNKNEKVKIYGRNIKVLLYTMLKEVIYTDSKSKSAKISPYSHTWIMKYKGDRTVAEFIDYILKNFYIEENLPKLRPKVFENISFKCNLCKDIVQIPGLWEQSTIPNIDQILPVMNQIIPHNKYLDVNHINDNCEGELYFYNLPMRSSKSIPINPKDVFYIACLDSKKIIIKKIRDTNGIDNYYVGYLDEPYGTRCTFLKIPLQDIYRNLEIIGRRNRSEPLKNTLKQIFQLDIKDIKNPKKDLGPIAKIFETNQIIPEGIFKEICLYIPALRWTQNRTKTKYGTDTMVGDSMLMMNIMDIIDKKINWEKAFNRFRT